MTLVVLVLVCISYFEDVFCFLVFLFLKWLGCSLLLSQKGEAEGRGVMYMEGGETWKRRREE